MSSAHVAAASADALFHQALAWQVTLWSGEVSDAERAEFERWLHADPAHQAAWGKAQSLHARLADLPAGLGAQVLRAPPPRLGRRRALGMLGWLVGGALALQGARQTPQWQLATADHATRRGERRQLVLEDGTRIDLNSASAVDIHYDDEVRRITLRHGEIFIATAKDPARRPFTVRTGHGEIQALGTRFQVHQESAHVHVAVFDGAVAVRPAQGPERRLDAGRQAYFDASGVQVETAAEPAAIAWTRGQLVAERLRLDEFIAQLARHRPGFLRCDPAVAELTISGVFPLDDTDRVLRALTEALPVRLSQVTPYWVTVTPR
ncbi:DUF4880 domain-containing protein [Pseudothauera nasutitermitis]|uniref:DUF4880 domain-containing protein n=1 Tax=Pseudothauera nasutitermitis TaxID=2565930 RepID=A0A4V3WC86_9RHOO|nr:FecR domain-containing protein [Pseudothauera nasutitermitis]THF66158.1 DUF4880 domain-containing protein [Pseudothauera nasutitermitis]